VGAEHLQGRAIVDVLTRLERLDERGLVGQVCQHAQLDLRVVRGNQHVPGSGDKRPPNLASELGANRDVLKVGIRAAQAASCRNRLVEAGVHTPGDRMYKQGQRIDVRALQLVESAPVE